MGTPLPFANDAHVSMLALVRLPDIAHEGLSEEGKGDNW